MRLGARARAVAVPPPRVSEPITTVEPVTIKVKKTHLKVHGPADVELVVVPLPGPPHHVFRLNVTPCDASEGSGSGTTR